MKTEYRDHEAWLAAAKKESIETKSYDVMQQLWFALKGQQVIGSFDTRRSQGWLDTEIRVHCNKKMDTWRNTAPDETGRLRWYHYWKCLECGHTAQEPWT